MVLQLNAAQADDFAASDPPGTVPVVYLPVRPRTITRVSSTDAHTTTFVLSHSQQRDEYAHAPTPPRPSRWLCPSL